MPNNKNDSKFKERRRGTRSNLEDERQFPTATKKEDYWRFFRYTKKKKA